MFGATRFTWLLLVIASVVSMVVISGCSEAVPQRHETPPEAPKPIVLGPGEGRTIQMSPDEQVIFKLGKGESGSDFEFAEVKIKPNGGPPEHIHLELDEAFYVMRGTVRVKIGEEIIEAKEGSFVFIPQGTSHAFVNSGTEDGTLVVVSSEVGLEAYLREVAEALRKMPPGPPNMESLAPILKKYKAKVVGPPLGAMPPASKEGEH